MTPEIPVLEPVCHCAQCEWLAQQAADRDTEPAPKDANDPADEGPCAR